VRDFSLGRLAGLTLTAAPSAPVGSLALWLALSALAFFWRRLPLGAAVLGGLLAVCLHWLGGTLHQLGHAWAARRTGHPMQGIRYWSVLDSSIYPEDEGELPARVHIRRALGGPTISLVTCLAAGVLAALLFPLGGLARFLSLFALIDYLGVFTLGALLPLGFTDGSTLLHWFSRR
jgi:hypothetical protein